MKLSILMPVFNEERTLKTIVTRVLAQHVEGVKSLELVIVDDGSTDNSAAVIRELTVLHPQLKVVYNNKNRGKGAVIRDAIEVATGDIAIIQDADLEYDPREYPHILSPIIDGDADVVYGSRFVTNGPRRVLYFRHAIGNRILTLLSNICTDLYLTDMETCYKAFRMPVLKSIKLCQDRFGFEPEITAKIANGVYRVYEVPIFSYQGRTYAEGKKIGWKDGLQAIWVILKYRFVD